MGLEWNPLASELNPIGNYILATERGERPMVNVGTSSDRLGTPAGTQAYYITAAREFQGTPWGGYVSINYSEHDRRLNLPFGANYRLRSDLTLMFMHDGRRNHLLLTHMRESWSITAMLVWMKHPGIAFSFGF